MKIKIMMLKDNDKETGYKFEIPDLTDFVADTIYFRLLELCIK